MPFNELVHKPKHYGNGYCVKNNTDLLLCSHNGVGDDFVRYQYFRFIKTRRTFHNVSLNENQQDYEMTSDMNKN